MARRIGLGMVERSDNFGSAGLAPADTNDAVARADAWFAREIGSGRVFTPHEVIVCPGGQAAIACTLRALVPQGRPLLVEAPTYTGAIAAARASGLELVPVATDADGVRPDLLADAFHRSGATAFYCQPTFSNPSGAILSAERRTQVLDVAAQARAFIIEDDWERDLYMGSAPRPPLAVEDQHGHVVYIRSLAKSAAPGLRVAAIMANDAEAAMARLRDHVMLQGERFNNLVRSLHQFNGATRQ